MSYLTKIVFVLVCLAIIEKCSGKLLSDSGFTLCHVKDANFETCLNEAIESALKLIKDGLPEYNLLPFDPFHLPSLTVGAGAGAVHLTQNYANLIITGFSSCSINNSHVDFDKKVLSFSAMHTLLTQSADYDVAGKILMLPVHGKGPCTVALENCFSDHRIEFDEKKEGDKVYFVPRTYTVKLHPARARYQFDNLFDGNKLLGDNINRVVNEEWLTIFRDVAEGYEKAYADVFLQYSKAIFAEAAINEIFPQ